MTRLIDEIRNRLLDSPTSYEGKYVGDKLILSESAYVELLHEIMGSNSTIYFEKFQDWQPIRLFGMEISIGTPRDKFAIGWKCYKKFTPQEQAHYVYKHEKNTFNNHHNIHYPKSLNHHKNRNR
jgi:hypothetical protein